jgi:hypothetical protein
VQEIHRARWFQVVRLQQADHEVEKQRDDKGDIDAARHVGESLSLPAFLERDRHAASSRERNV